MRLNPQNFGDLRGDETNCGIVFCPHVNGTLGVVQVAERLGHKNYYSGSKPRAFQGSDQQWNQRKISVQEDFKRNASQELVATKSFGMGIDKPNIRYTVHYTMPQSVEAFYQEAGRAGRNGRQGYALCSIIYSDDNWDYAQELLNEPDHSKARKKFETNKVKWDDRGDILTLLWFLFNSYQGQDEGEKAFDFWKRNLAPKVERLPIGAKNTADISFTSEKDRETKEKSIFRLMLLGVVDDYTIDWQKKHFAVQVNQTDSLKIREHLHKYLSQYKLGDYAEKKLKSFPQDTVENSLQKALSIMIDFIYDEVVAKRKQALRTMGELCRNFKDGENFRESILSYLQESEFSDELKKWVGSSYNDIGLERIDKLLKQVDGLDQAKRLVGTTRRMLDEDLGNLALRYLSVCARTISETESDKGILDETRTLATQIQLQRKDLKDCDDILISLSLYIDSKRSSLLNRVGKIIFTHAGTYAFSRRVLKSGLLHNKVFYENSVELISLKVFQTLKEMKFLKSK